jgi:uncharacterized RDD family membrane protein YckC
MKCPKCSYLGFERVDRCRNCGYDFSLSAHQPEQDFAIRRDTAPAGPLEDLTLIDPAGDWQLERPMSDLDLDRIFGAPQPQPARAASRSMSAAAVAELPRRPLRAELPLFGPPVGDDEPLIKKASPPRSPLAVRRATPDVPRLRADAPLRTSSFDLTLDLAHAEPVAIVRRRDRVATPVPLQDEQESQNAGIGARLLAVMVDLLILAAIDAAVVYFTIQLCNLTINDLGILPKGPLVAFLLVQNGGYLVAFTAGGQTLGKMVAGIRVVQSDAEGSLDLGRAFLRTVMWIVLAVPAGLGFLTALFSRDHRGLHDRFAGTRVVRASV